MATDGALQKWVHDNATIYDIRLVTSPSRVLAVGYGSLGYAIPAPTPTGGPVELLIPTWGLTSTRQHEAGVWHHDPAVGWRLKANGLPTLGDGGKPIYWLWVAANPNDYDEWLLLGNTYAQGPTRGFKDDSSEGGYLRMADGVTHPLWYTNNAGASWAAVPVPRTTWAVDTFDIFSVEWDHSVDGRWRMNARGRSSILSNAIFWRGEHGACLNEWHDPDGLDSPVFYGCFGENSEWIVGTMRIAATGGGGLIIGWNDTLVGGWISGYVYNSQTYYHQDIVRYWPISGHPRLWIAGTLNTIQRENFFLVDKLDYKDLDNPNFLGDPSVPTGKWVAPTAATSSSSGTTRYHAFVGGRQSGGASGILHVGYIPDSSPPPFLGFSEVVSGTAGKAIGHTRSDNRLRTLVAARDLDGLGYLTWCYDGSAWSQLTGPFGTTKSGLADMVEVLNRP